MGDVDVVADRDKEQDQSVLGSQVLLVLARKLAHLMLILMRPQAALLGGVPHIWAVEAPGLGHGGHVIAGGIVVFLLDALDQICTQRKYRD